MIDLNERFFSTIRNFKSQIDIDLSRNSVLDNCVTERISDIIKLQSSILDDNLKKLDKAVEFNFNNINDIKRLTNILESLYKCIAKDRLKLFNILVDLSEDNLYAK